MTSSIGSYTSEPRIVMSNASSEYEKQIDAIEKEALETIEHLSKQKQNQYKTMVFQGANKIRMHIANLRSSGKNEYEITKILEILMQDFKNSNETFILKNQIWNTTNEVAINNIQHNAHIINKLNFDFGKMKCAQFGDKADEASEFSLTADVSSDKKGIQ